MFETLNVSSHSVGPSERQGARGSHSAPHCQVQSQESCTDSEDCGFANGRATAACNCWEMKLQVPRFPGPRNVPSSGVTDVC